jgi:hypothetical protein
VAAKTAWTASSRSRPPLWVIRKMNPNSENEATVTVALAAVNREKRKKCGTG